MKKSKKGIVAKIVEDHLKNHQYKEQIASAIDLIANLVGILAIVFIVRTYVISPFQVYGISMCNTLNHRSYGCLDSFGDYLIISKSSYLQVGNWSMGAPKRGDIVVFKPPHGHDYYIKRVIGLPGETIKLIDGFVYIYNEEYPNGWKLPEEYLSEENAGKTFAIGGISEFNVPEGKYFVMGDNRQKSSDSRICFKDSPAAPGCENPNVTPYLSASEMEGRAAIVLWPQPHLLNPPQYQ